MKNTNYLLVCLLLLLASVQTVNAQSWQDITDTYVQNPRYDNNTDEGWSLSGYVAGNNVNYNCRELWYSYWTYDYYQVLPSLPKGKYRISLQAYYRDGGFNQQKAMTPSSATRDVDIYAVPFNSVTGVNDESQRVYTPVKGYYDEYMTRGGSGNFRSFRDGGQYRYYPDNMEAANYSFNTAGKYNNALEYDHPGGPFAIGLYLNNSLAENWTIWDNWKLEIWSNPIKITSISLSESQLNLGPNETVTLVMSYQPEFVTEKNIQWTSSNAAVASVDQNGVVKGTGNGSATITCEDKSSGKKATCRVTVVSSEPSSANIIINEIQVRNIDMFIDPTFNYGGWIELYNPTSAAVSLDGCYIKDSRGNEWQIPAGSKPVPAKGYRNVWFDHSDVYGLLSAIYQVPFKLDTDGGTIMVCAPNGVVIAEVEYPVTYMRSSWARKTDAGSDWAYTDTPTPEATNAGSQFAMEQLEAPMVDHESCLFTSPFTVTVSIPAGQTLKYTTDGSAPSMSNGYVSNNGVFSVPTETTIYRFRLFKDGNIASDVVTRSFIFNDKGYDLPIISVNTDPRNLYDDMIGVYVRGKNGRPGNGVVASASDRANWNMDWERPVHFDYITPEGNVEISQETDYAISGGWSRMWSQAYGSPQSFKLKSGKIYGINEISHRFFDQKPYNKYKQILVRNGGNDHYNQSRTKDNILQQIIIRSGLYVDCQERKAAHVFHNGEFKGTMNIREVSNKQFGYSNYGLDTDAQDAFEMSTDSGYVQGAGDRVAFEELYEVAKTPNDPVCWSRIEELVDIDEFINYCAVQYYLVNWDWPHNNMKAFRGRYDENAGQKDGRFHFVIFDLDNCYDQSFNPFSEFDRNQYYTFFGCFIPDGNGGYKKAQYYKEVELVTIMQNLLKNEDFKKRVIDAFCVVAGSVFEPTRCEEIIDEISDEMYPYMDWEYNGYYVNQVSSFLKGKLTKSMQNTNISYMNNYFKLTDNLTATLSSNIDNGVIEINGMKVPTGKFSGKLNAPITISAKAPAGYKFKGWKSPVSGGVQTKNLFDRGAEWKYYDQGSLDGQNWTENNYNTSDWKTGTAGFGYNLRNGAVESTTLDFGGDASNKRPTYYFRKNVQLNDKPAPEDSIVITMDFDDGYILYVNGKEVVTKRLSSGASYSDYAWEYGADPWDTDEIQIPASYFRKGDNVIAVELHNQSATSSDVYFDAALSYSSAVDMGEYLSYDPEMELQSGMTYDLVAEWGEMTPAEKAEEGLNTAPVVINEVSAGNNVYINDYYKKDDWVELYNTTDNDIDLEGMYLSDNSAKPQKYQITAAGTKASTIIKAHGYKIIWCSKRDTDKDLHASFKLSNEDGQVIRLMAADQSWADSLKYCYMEGDQTFGRYPDGGTQTYLMTLPTIDKSNQLTMYSKEWHYVPEEPTAVEDMLAIRNNGMSVGLEGDYVIIRTSEAMDARITFSNLSGVVVLDRTVSVDAGEARVNISALKSGIYTVRVVADDESVGVKFRK